MLFEETTGTLLCGDLFTQLGNGEALTTGDIVEPAVEGELLFHASSLAPSTAVTIAGLADLEPTTLALMHGPSFAGDCKAALRDLAGAYDERFLAGSSA